MSISKPVGKCSRRRFLQSSSAVLTVAVAFPARSQDKPRHKVERLGIGAIGMRYQGSVITRQAELYGDVVAVCDVDRHVREQARASFGSTASIHEDYREVLARDDVDVILIATPDHWHAKMLIDSCRAGKDVYCEKPLTLTIDEGKLIRQVVAETGRIVQVGTWQRSDHRFRLAVEMVRSGRLGRLRRVTCITDKNPTGGPFAARRPPAHLNWDLWQGQTPNVPYLPERCHYTFRWWYEYAGGKMTDWGAHHIDIAQWAVDSVPVKIETTSTLPETPDSYNVASDFSARILYKNGVELLVRDEGRRGILFEGDEGRIFVNRGVLTGKPVEELATRPLPREGFSIYPYDNLVRPERFGKLDAIVNHIGNFVDCIETGNTPISDAESQHRSATTCHLANISMRIGRPLRWDGEKESVIGDDAANRWLKRDQRVGFEVI